MVTGRDAAIDFIGEIIVLVLKPLVNIVADDKRPAKVFCAVGAAVLRDCFGFRSFSKALIDEISGCCLVIEGFFFKWLIVVFGTAIALPSVLLLLYLLSKDAYNSVLELWIPIHAAFPTFLELLVVAPP